MSKKVSASFVPDQFQEKRKKHKKKKDKLVKKLQQKKSRKRIKKEKSDAKLLEKQLQNYQKHNQCTKQFATKVTGKDIDLIKKIMGESQFIMFSQTHQQR